MRKVFFIFIFMVWFTVQARISRQWTENQVIVDSAMLWSLPRDYSHVGLEACVSMKGPSDRRGADRYSWDLILMLADGTRRVVTVGWGNTDLGDFADIRYLSVTGVTSEPVRLTEDVSLYKGDNYIVVEINTHGEARVYVGNDVMNYVGSISLSAPVDIVSIGSKDRMELAFMAIECEREPVLDSGLDGRELELACNTDLKAPFGVWRYLDRDNNTDYARPGGYYTLVGIQDPDDSNGFLLLYLDGAKVNADGWKPGMIKARMIPTGFVGRYRLEWYNADKSVLRDESGAVIEGDIMTLLFPLHKSQLRFSR